MKTWHWLVLPLTLLAGWVLVVERPREPAPAATPPATGTMTPFQPTRDPLSQPAPTPPPSATPREGFQRVFQALDAAQVMTLESIDPDSRIIIGEKRRATGPLGSVKLTGAEKKRVVEALRQAVLASDGNGASCFNPRHVLRVKGGEVWICFECSRIQASFGKGQWLHLTTTGSAEAVFNETLRRHHIPLSPH